MNTTITTNVVETNGTIDEYATQQNFSTELTKLQNERTNRLERILTAVTTIFDRFPGGRINLPDLSTMILVELGLTPSEYAAWRPVVLSFIRDNCQGEQKGTHLERPESMLVMQRGKGGVGRRADLKAATQAERTAA